LTSISVDFHIIDAEFLNVVTERRENFRFTKRALGTIDSSLTNRMYSKVMPTARFTVLEHTADAGIIAYGRTLAELFENAAEGLFASMAVLEGVAEREQREIAVEGRDIEGLLVHWLTELLYYVDAEEMLFRRFEITEIDDHHLLARAYGERIDRERHEFHFGVKAITRHMLEVRRTGDGYEATVLFDI
jgi:SHS2 domain-containing protein